MRKLLAVLMLSGSIVQGAVNVYTTNTAPPTLQNDIIAGLTTQYNATVTPGFFVGTYTVNVSSKNPVPPCGGTVYLPSQLDQDVSSIVGVTTNSYVYGFANGMDTERYADVQTINGLFSADVTSGTCGGIAISSFPYTIQIAGPLVMSSSSSARSVASSRVVTSTTTVVNSSMTVISSTITLTNNITVTNTYNWVPPTNVLWLTPPVSALSSCESVYGVVASTINLRWGQVFPSTAPVPGGP